MGYRVTNHRQHVLKHPANTLSTEDHTLKVPCTSSSLSGLEEMLDLSPIFRWDSGMFHIKHHCRKFLEWCQLELLYPREEQAIPQQIQSKSWSYIAIGSYSSPHNPVSGEEQKSNSSSKALKSLICALLSKGATSLSAEQEYGEGSERATFHCKSWMLEASAHNRIYLGTKLVQVSTCVYRRQKAAVLYSIQ